MRTWIVASVTWIVLVIVVANPAATPPVLLHDGNQSLQFPADTPRKAVEKAVTDYVKETRAKDPYAGVGTPVETVEQEVNRVVGDYQPVSRWRPWADLAPIALLPPVLLLVGALLLGWVIRGFQSGRSATSN